MTSKTLIPAIALALMLPVAANAACVATYKAKMDAPLRLDFGEMTVNTATCTPDGVRQAVADALRAQGWILLTIVSVSEGGA